MAITLLSEATQDGIEPPRKVVVGLKKCLPIVFSVLNKSWFELKPFLNKSSYLIGS